MLVIIKSIFVVKFDNFCVCRYGCAYGWAGHRSFTLARRCISKRLSWCAKTPLLDHLEVALFQSCCNFTPLPFSWGLESQSSSDIWLRSIAHRTLQGFCFGCYRLKALLNGIVRCAMAETMRNICIASLLGKLRIVSSPRVFKELFVRFLFLAPHMSMLGA